MNGNQTFELCKRLDGIEKQLANIYGALDTLNKNLMIYFRGEMK